MPLYRYEIAVKRGENQTKVVEELVAANWGFKEVFRKNSNNGSIVALKELKDINQASDLMNNLLKESLRIHSINVINQDEEPKSIWKTIFN